MIFSVFYTDVLPSFNKTNVFNGLCFLLTFFPRQLVLEKNLYIFLI